MLNNDFTFARGTAICRRFSEREGHLVIPKTHEEDGVRLSNWVGSRRREYANGTLRADRAAVLETVPHWTWTGAGAVHRRAQASNRFHADAAAVTSWVHAGNALVDIPGTATVDGVRIGHWVARFRVAHRDGLLTHVQTTALTSIPGWGAGESSSEIRWAEGMADVRAFKAEFGHLRVPNRFVTANGRLLGRFVAEARTLRRAGKLLLRREAELNQLAGWEWAAARGRPRVNKA